MLSEHLQVAAASSSSTNDPKPTTKKSSARDLGSWFLRQVSYMQSFSFN